MHLQRDSVHITSFHNDVAGDLILFGGHGNAIMWFRVCNYVIPEKIDEGHIDTSMPPPKRPPLQLCGLQFFK